jgi:hypothetical protein
MSRSRVESRGSKVEVEGRKSRVQNGKYFFINTFLEYYIFRICYFVVKILKVFLINNFINVSTEQCLRTYN